MANWRRGQGRRRTRELIRFDDAATLRVDAQFYDAQPPHGVSQPQDKKSQHLRSLRPAPQGSFQLFRKPSLRLIPRILPLLAKPAHQPNPERAIRSLVAKGARFEILSQQSALRRKEEPRQEGWASGTKRMCSWHAHPNYLTPCSPSADAAIRSFLPRR